MGTGFQAAGRCGRVRAVLMAAGLGTRLRPLTERVPKCLVPVAGRPLLDYWFDLLAEAGIADVLINTHHLPELVRRFVAERNATGAHRIVERHEPTLLGSAGTVHATRDWADAADTLLIAYADNLTDLDLSALLAFHASHDDPLTMTLFRASCPERCGIAEVDGQGRITKFEEKPAVPRGNLANAGVYCVTADGYREMADLRGFDLGFDVLPRFSGRTRAYPWAGYLRDIGDAASLAEAESDVRAGRLRLLRAGVPSAGQESAS